MADSNVAVVVLEMTIGEDQPEGVYGDILSAIALNRLLRFIPIIPSAEEEEVCIKECGERFSTGIALICVAFL